MKLREPRHEITIFERSAPGATGGWGVVFWDDLWSSFTARHTKSPYSAGLAGGLNWGSASFTADTKAERRLRKVSPLTTEVDGPDAPQVGPVAGQQAPPPHRQ
jgi:hypothetical protein